MNMNSEDSQQNKIPSNKIEVLKCHKRKADHDEQDNKRICSRNISRGLSSSCIDETEYYFENFLRKVYPYYFTYTTHCKGRWVGKRLIDVFSEEFRAHSKEEYEKNIESGNIRINTQTITTDYIFKENDLVTNKSHRHETAVLAAPIKIIYNDKDFVVVNKPPSIPIHPCGRYRHNSLIFILAKEHNLTELYSVHRLDRLTSGVLLFTKTIGKSQEINKQIRDRKVKKEYVCRVEGEFPDEVVTCNEPIEVISPKMGVCIVSQAGKDCETVFSRISYNGKSSVVCCKPLTGRTHQIRVHLQYLGFPIINDPIYNNKKVFGHLNGKGGEYFKSKEELLQNLLSTHNLDKWLLEDLTPLQNSVGNEISIKEDSDANTIKKDIDLDNKIALDALEYYLESEKHEEFAKNYVKKPEKFITEKACDLCHQTYMDPQPKDLILFLHALKYEGDGWSFCSELPSWARDDWNETTVT